MRPTDILLDDETLFKSEEVFTPSYVPDDFTHRDDQLKEMSLSIKPGLRGVNPINTLIHGPPGTGKTTAMKYLFNQVNEMSGKLKTVYVNCEDNNTRFSIFSKIHEEVFGHSPPDTGKPLNTVKEKVFKKLEREGKSLCVCLDEMDLLFLNKTIDSLLIDLLKAHTTYGYDKVGVIGIMIDETIINDLEAKTMSVFNPVRVYFPPYSSSEVYDILARRVDYGLYDGVITDKLVEYIAGKTSEVGDLRVGIDLIRRSAMLAERDSERRISKQHVEEALEKDSRRVGLVETVKVLDEDERNLLELISRNDGMKSGDVYKRIKEDTGVGVRKYNDMIKKLEYYKLIDTVAAEGRGQSRYIKLRNTSEEVDAALNGI
ncbi:MAG: ORC1-type DNA replication protein [Candidatus Altiarchaeota archaeon]